VFGTIVDEPYFGDIFWFAIEQERKLGRDVIVQHRTEVGNEPLKKLTAFRPFQVAKRAATKEIETLRKREYVSSQRGEVRSPERMRTRVAQMAQSNPVG
jgi:hypothetical protein